MKDNGRGFVRKIYLLILGSVLAPVGVEGPFRDCVTYWDTCHTLHLSHITYLENSKHPNN